MTQSAEPQSSSSEFDYSTPEAQAALQGVSRLILEIRDEYAEPIVYVTDPSSERKLRLYERTLGLAVVPVLIRRAVVRLLQRLRRGNDITE